MANYDSTHTGATIDSAVSQVTDSTTDLNIDSNTLVVDKSANSVGIGITAPDSPLVVVGDVKFLSSTGDEARVFFDVGAGGNPGKIFVYDATPTQKIRLDSSGESYFNGGNVGIGVTPETDWHSTWSALQFGGNGALSAHASAGAGKAVFLSQNARYISSNSSDGAKYIDTDEASEVFLVDGTIRLRTAVSGAADAAITWTTPMTIANSGDVTFTGDLIMADGKGIDFSANTSDAAGMTAEILDDYEEGTWDAVVTDGTNPMTMSYDEGYYTKVGNLVTVSGYFATTSLGSASGNIRITGLPFTIASNNAAYSGGVAGYGEGLAITAGQSVSYYGGTNNTYIVLRVWNATAGTTSMIASEWTADGGIIIGFSYRAA